MSIAFPRGATDLPLVQTRALGDLRLHAIDGGLQWLDGGAMFGVVPKPLWERRIPADERNRIPLAARSLLVATPDELVLIETGLGNKSEARAIEIYGIDTLPPDPAMGPDRLQAGVREAGHSPDEVTLVVNTHLHFDHAGGNTFHDAGGELRLAFPRARYTVQWKEWEYAHSTNERTRASYLRHDFDPVHAAGAFDFLHGAGELIPGVAVVPTPGHTPHHQSVLVRSAGETACYLGDLVPTMAHLPLPWIMGYDVEPLVTLESKRTLLARALEEGWLLVSTHDPVTAWGYLEQEEKKLVLRDRRTSSSPHGVQGHPREER
jgi:glyoxylase-like metal-dependent hydrolase (beta-lactamase superfamily II)